MERLLLLFVLLSPQVFGQQTHTSIYVKNGCASNIDVVVSRNLIDVNPNTSTYMVWDQAYIPTVDSTFSLTILPGDSALFFSVYAPNGQIDSSLVEYCFYNLSNLSDTTCRKVLMSASISSDTLESILMDGCLCSDTIVDNTITYAVCDTAFSNMPPTVFLESIDSFSTAQGGCDSLVYHYVKFSYDFATNWDTVTLYDTTYISITDTLIIDITLTGVSPPNNTNTLKVYPNPAKDQLYIDNGYYLSMSGYTLKIVNSVGQDVFSSLITIPLFVIDINTLGSTGLYFIQVIDGSSNVLENKKLVLE